jgi:hypothetical protein
MNTNHRSFAPPRRSRTNSWFDSRASSAPVLAHNIDNIDNGNTTGARPFPCSWSIQHTNLRILNQLTRYVVGAPASLSTERKKIVSVVVFLCTSFLKHGPTSINVQVWKNSRWSTTKRHLACLGKLDVVFYSIINHLPKRLPSSSLYDTSLPNTRTALLSVFVRENWSPS